MSTRPALVLAVLALAASAQAQPPQPGRPIAYRTADEDPVEPRKDELGLPRTPRLSLMPTASYVSMSLEDFEPIDVLGVGGQLDLHVPLTGYALVGLRIRHQERTFVSGPFEGNLFSDGRDAGTLSDLGVVAQLRLVHHSIELGGGFAFGTSRWGGGGVADWTWFADPHVSLRIGRTVAFTAGAGVVVRRWGGVLTELGAHVELGLSFLLWSPR